MHRPPRPLAVLAALTLCASALTIAGCLGGALSHSDAAPSSLTPRAVVASNGDDAFTLNTQDNTREQPKPAADLITVTVAPDPLTDNTPSLLIDVPPEVQSLSVAALSVASGEAALFWQGGVLASPDMTRKLWTRSAASPQRLAIPLDSLWTPSGPRGLIALTLDADIEGAPSVQHRALLNAAPFTVSARREGGTLYAQIQLTSGGSEAASEADRADAAFTVEVIDPQGRTLAQGRACAEGALKLSHPMFNAAPSLLVIARRGVERAFTAIQP